MQVRDALLRHGFTPAAWSVAGRLDRWQRLSAECRACRGFFAAIFRSTAFINRAWTS